MPTVFDTVHAPDGTIAVGARVSLDLIAEPDLSGGEGFTPTATILGTSTTKTDATGRWEFANVTPNDQIVPPGSAYQLRVAAPFTTECYYIVVPDEPGPLKSGDLVTPTPTPGPFPPGKGGGYATFDVRHYSPPLTSAAINQASADAKAAGGGTVFIPAGRYVCTPTIHPQDSTYHPAILLRSGVIIHAEPGAILELATIAPGSTGNYYLALNEDIQSGADHNITVEGGLWDGKAASQTVNAYGVCMMRVTNGLFRDVHVRDVRGTALSGADETFHLSATLCQVITVDHCVVEGTAGSTASGFDANTTNDMIYMACRAAGMSVGNGFTHHSCNSLRHLGCTAVNNTNIGFNSELSNDISYLACFAPDNGDRGFTLNATHRATLDTCLATGNIQGLNLAAGATAWVFGGGYKDNSMFGIGYPQDCTLQLLGGPVCTGNGTAAISGYYGYLQSSTGPVITGPVAASGTVVPNPFPSNVFVVVTGGTVSQITVQGAVTNQTHGTFLLSPGHTITIDYTVAPFWQWWMIA